MEREDKQMEITLDSMLQRCQDLMKAMSAFLYRIETEQLDYKDYVDAYAAFQGHIHQLMKVIKNNHQLLANRSVFPIKLTPNDDEGLTAATEGRLKTLNHDSCPIYLRTKYDPEIETRFNHFLQRGNLINPDQAQKQIASANKIVQNITDLIRNHREESESDQNRNSFPPTSSNVDTYTLAGALFYGKGLRTGADGISSSVASSTSSSGAVTGNSAAVAATTSNVSGVGTGTKIGTSNVANNNRDISQSAASANVRGTSVGVNAGTTTSTTVGAGPIMKSTGPSIKTNIKSATPIHNNYSR